MKIEELKEQYEKGIALRESPRSTIIAWSIFKYQLPKLLKVAETAKEYLDYSPESGTGFTEAHRRAEYLESKLINALEELEK